MKTPIKVVDTDPQDPYEGDLPDGASIAQSRAAREGAEFDAVALHWIQHAGATVVQRGRDIRGVPIDAVVQGSNGSLFTVLAHGNIDRDGKRPGLRRTDTVRKVGSSAYLLTSVVEAPPVLVITSDIPKESGRTKQAARLLALHQRVIFDVLSPEDVASFHRLQRYLTGKPAPDAPEPAPWRALPTDQLSLEVWRTRA